MFKLQGAQERRLAPFHPPTSSEVAEMALKWVFHPAHSCGEGSNSSLSLPTCWYFVSATETVSLWSVGVVNWKNVPMIDIYYPETEERNRRLSSFWPTSVSQLE